MASNAKSLWSGIKLGSRATVLAIFLLAPFVYYELRGGRWGITIGVLAALVPLIFTLVYTCFYREADENSVARVATNFLAGSAFTVVYICLHYGSWQTAFLQLI